MNIACDKGRLLGFRNYYFESLLGYWDVFIKIVKLEYALLFMFFPFLFLFFGHMDHFGTGYHTVYTTQLFLCHELCFLFWLPCLTVGYTDVIMQSLLILFSIADELCFLFSLPCLKIVCNAFFRLWMLPSQSSMREFSRTRKIFFKLCRMQSIYNLCFNL